MADSVREQILQRITEALEADHAAKPIGTKVHRHRTVPIWQDQLPAVLPYWTEETIEEEGHDGTVLRRMVVRLEHRAEVQGATPHSSREIPERALDAALIWTTQAMLGDDQLRGLVNDVREVGTGTDTIEATKTFVGAGQDWEIRYWTLAADPTQRP